MAEQKLILKLLVDKENQKVLFAEAQKPVVDFLFGLLSLPLGTVSGKLVDKGMAGSASKLYSSVRRMSATYLQANFDRSVLLNPPASSPSFRHAPFLLDSPQSTTPVKTFYGCGSGNYAGCRNIVSDGKGAICSECNREMAKQLSYVSPPKPVAVVHDEGGYVKGVATYKVTDDLTVEPMSTISSIMGLLSKFHINDIESLEERTVNLGTDEGLRLLKYCFQSTTVLTDVFIRKRDA